MGEEYGEIAPFPYFISHGDAELVAAVRQGRNDEFLPFAWQGHPPDPQAESTFLSAKIDPEQRRQGEQRALFTFYNELIRLRKECPPLAQLDRAGMEIHADEDEQLLAITRRAEGDEILCFFNYSDQSRVLRPPLLAGALQVLLDSAGHSPPGQKVVVNSAHPETFPTLAPFGVLVYRQIVDVQSTAGGEI